MNDKLEFNKKQNGELKQEGLISVVVPIYNTESYLKKCVDSIINQTYTNIEIILVDDGSIDNSGKICDEYEKKDNRIRVLHKKNEGVSSARNKGIEEASGEYIGFVDSDDYIESTMYEKLLNSIINNKTDIAICNYSSNNEFDLKKNILSQQEMFDLILDKDKFRGYTCNKIYKVELLKEIKFNTDISLCEDLLFNCEYFIKCKNMSVVNEKLYNYIKREKSACGTFLEKHFSVIEAYKKIEEIYTKHSKDNLLKLQMAYLKQCTFLKYYNFMGNYSKKYKELIDKDAKRLIKIINKSRVNVKNKIILNTYYNFPVLIGKLRKIKNV